MGPSHREHPSSRSSTLRVRCASPRWEYFSRPGADQQHDARPDHRVRRHRPRGPVSRPAAGDGEGQHLCRGAVQQGSLDPGSGSSSWCSRAQMARRPPRSPPGRRRPLSPGASSPCRAARPHREGRLRASRRRSGCQTLSACRQSASGSAACWPRSCSKWRRSSSAWPSRPLSWWAGRLRTWWLARRPSTAPRRGAQAPLALAPHRGEDLPLVALAWGVVLVFLTPPLQTFDELAHYYRAWSVAEGQFVVPDSGHVRLPSGAEALTGLFPDRPLAFRLQGDAGQPAGRSWAIAGDDLRSVVVDGVRLRPYRLSAAGRGHRPRLAHQGPAPRGAVSRPPAEPARGSPAHVLRLAPCFRSPSWRSPSSPCCR